jgi:hypothetical protein
MSHGAGKGGLASSSHSKELMGIESELQEMRERKQLNAINLYMLGVILR